MNNAFLIEENNSLKQELETLRNTSVEEDEDEEEEIWHKLIVWYNSIKQMNSWIKERKRWNLKLKKFLNEI